MLQQSHYLSQLTKRWLTAFLFLTSSFFSSVSAQRAPHVISFFMRPLPAYPTPAQEKIIEKHKTKKTSDSVLKSIIKKEFSPQFLHSGVYATYAGMGARSDNDGQIMFERKTPETKLHVIVTEDIKAVPIDPANNKTIYGFVLNPKARAQQYLFELLQDPETEIYSWNVSSIPLSKNKTIPFDTLIIMANPKHIVVPIGSTATEPSENFILPDFYVTKSLSSAANALHVLKVRQYFAPMKFEYKFYPEEYQQIMRS